jgi:tetratricopeptide (TPR) repeat protein
METAPVEVTMRPRQIASVVLAIVVSAALVAGQTAGVGEVRFANSGAASAQAPFLAGLAQLHNFEYDAAAELFRKAQSIDPGFAMAYWGEAMTYNHPVWMQQDRDAALKAVSRLGASPDARLAKAPTEREKDYMRALDVLYGAGDKNARDFAYADAMASLYRKYPTDPDAATFYALALLGTAHAGRDFATYMRAAAVAEAVFRDHPNHPGAAHYLIHSYDDPIHAPLGLRAARAYSEIAPAAPHAQHMTSHIFVALGMWDDVVGANETAIRVVDRARKERGQPPSTCGHYNTWLEYGYLQQGRLADAKKLVAECLVAAGGTVEGHHGGDAPAPGSPSSVGPFATMRARYLIDTEDWKGDVAAWKTPSAGPPAAQVTAEFINGFAAVRTGNLAAARESLARLAKARGVIDAQFEKSGDVDQAPRTRAKVLEMQLGAMIQVAEGGAAAAIDRLREAAAIEEKTPFEFGPPFIDKPSHELLGETLLAAGRAKDARAAFEAALARTPGRTTSLLGLMRAATAAGDQAKAAEVRGQLRTIWRRADSLPAEVK